MRNRIALLVVGTALWLTVFGLYGDASAQKRCDGWLSRVVSIQGRVLVKSHGSTQWHIPRLDEYLCPGDRLSVDKYSRAAMILSNGSVLRIDQNTTLIFITEEEEKTILIRLLEGAVQFFSRQPRRLKVVTPFVNGVVRGTEFLVRVDTDRTRIILFEGRLLAENQAGSLALSAGQAAVAVAGQLPRTYAVARPRDAVQRVLYYPPVLSYRQFDFSFSDPSSWQAAIHRSSLELSEGNLSGAFEALIGLDEQTITDPRFFIYRAGLRLTVGRVAEAQADLAAAQALEDGRSDNLALKVVISVVQNRKSEALNLAAKAVAADGQSVATRIASSYAHQANFDLKRALADVTQAAEIDPEDTLVWARMSELRLSFGDLDGALNAARKAVAIQPRHPRALSVLGFAYLTRIKLEGAAQNFTDAISIDSASPLPRLGLGLAKIRQGDLSEGRAEIEIAAILDPGNSLIRSYLGKAYFDEIRIGLDARQFEIAKQLDPNDPTPWLYDSVRKLSVTQPVAALEDLERSLIAE